MSAPIFQMAKITSHALFSFPKIAKIKSRRPKIIGMRKRGAITGVPSKVPKGKTISTKRVMNNSTEDIVERTKTTFAPENLADPIRVAASFLMPLL